MKTLCALKSNCLMKTGSRLAQHQFWTRNNRVVGGVAKHWDDITLHPNARSTSLMIDHPNHHILS